MQTSYAVFAPENLRAEAGLPKQRASLTITPLLPLYNPYKRYITPTVSILFSIIPKEPVYGDTVCHVRSQFLPWYPPPRCVGPGRLQRPAIPKTSRAIATITNDMITITKFDICYPNCNISIMKNIYYYDCYFSPYSPKLGRCSPGSTS